MPGLEGLVRRRDEERRERFLGEQDDASFSAAERDSREAGDLGTSNGTAGKGGGGEARTTGSKLQEEEVRSSSCELEEELPREVPAENGKSNKTQPCPFSVPSPEADANENVSSYNPFETLQEDMASHHSPKITQNNAASAASGMLVLRQESLELHAALQGQLKRNMEIEERYITDVEQLRGNFMNSLEMKTEEMRKQHAEQIAQMEHEHEDEKKGIVRKFQERIEQLELDLQATKEQCRQEVLALQAALDGERAKQQHQGSKVSRVTTLKGADLEDDEEDLKRAGGGEADGWVSVEASVCESEGRRRRVYKRVSLTRRTLDVSDYDESTRSICGVGLGFDMCRGGSFVIRKTLPGSSADAHEEVAVGDRIVAVDGIPTWGLDMADVVSMIQGRAGTSVSLVIESDEEERNDSSSCSHASSSMDSDKPSNMRNPMGIEEHRDFFDVVCEEWREVMEQLEEEEGKARVRERVLVLIEVMRKQSCSNLGLRREVKQLKEQLRTFFLFQIKQEQLIAQERREAEEWRRHVNRSCIPDARW
eukprot:754376-Hanusia_phi.AAC.1